MIPSTQLTWNFYTMAVGVGVGDFNNDGLPDLYFTASTTSNKLYLNKGNFVFSDVTDEARVKGEGMVQCSLGGGY